MGSPIQHLPFAIMILTVGAISVVVGCGPDLYTLPDPPPKEEWVQGEGVQEEDENAKIRRYLDAKRATIQVYDALSKEEWTKALELMSQETQNFFQDASNGEGAEAALAKGELAFEDDVIPFSPLDDLLMADLVDIIDEAPGQLESETKRRKELYVVDKNRRARKIIVIYEADAWKLHSPFVRTPTFGLD